MWTFTALAAIVGAALLPGTAAAGAPAASTTGPIAQTHCPPARPGLDFYAGGRVASTPITVSTTACSTISVSHIRDVRAPNDRCQTFLLLLLSADGTDATATEPVRACSDPPNRRTVLARNVPDGTVFRVVYEVDYIDPVIQVVGYTVWR